MTRRLVASAAWLLAPTMAAPCARAASRYDAMVTTAHPSGFWDMSATGATETDLSGGGHAGIYLGRRGGRATLPDGEIAAEFDQRGQQLRVPSSPSFSITRTGRLSFGGSVRPHTLRWSSTSDPHGYGYVDWMGKCENYAPTCEWEARTYSSVNSQRRCSRVAAYVFNPSAGLGSGADWQPRCGMLKARRWLYVAGEYETLKTPSDCRSSSPGTIDISVDGARWNRSYHSPTGCMSQYSVKPKASRSPLDIGTVAMDTWFAGAVGKVAIYDYLLTQARIDAHYRAMTGERPSGSCRDICTVPVTPATAASAGAEGKDHNRREGTELDTRQPRQVDWEGRCAESSP